MALKCELTQLIQGSTNLNCSRVVGGVKTSFFGSWDDVDAVTVASGIITAITMKATKKLYEIQGDDDNTSTYNQISEKNGQLLRFNQSYSTKMSGTGNAKVVAANNMKGVKRLMIIHVMNDGTLLSQGVEQNPAGDGDAQYSYVAATVQPDVNGNTGETASDVTLRVESTSLDTLPCSMTEANVRLLTA